jgi:hypothetical protein
MQALHDVTGGMVIVPRSACKYKFPPLATHDSRKLAGIDGLGANAGERNPRASSRSVPIDDR